MRQIGASTESADVFREIIKERRETYYVTYQPADSRLRFAILSLVYPGSTPDVASIAEQMVHEMAMWLDRFPVPVMVSAFDASDECILVHSDSSSSHLMGFVDPLTSKTVSHWGVLSEKALPVEQSTSEYLSKVYDEVPFRLKAEVRSGAEKEALQLRRGIRLFRIASIFWVGIPLLIEVVSLGIGWIGYVLWTISVSVGSYEFAKTIGWIGRSKRQIERDEEMRKMRHYAFHCEINPAGFERLKIENFERDAMEETRKEFNSLPPTSRVAG